MNDRGVMRIIVVATLGLASVAAGQTVVDTDAKSPAEQAKLFRLPPGFAIQLVAAEPDIGQPMNLNFDARGRLWVTHTVEYPYPARGDLDERDPRFKGVGDHEPRDRLSVIEGIDPATGRAARVTHFAGGLNIPIGQMPLGDGSTALVYSIPRIDRVADTDGDGLADQRAPLYARFGNRDTHGMASSFTRWVDGWVYGCHGFANESRITDATGRVTTLKSGNTYRFRPDGSRFEQYTHGQVNPFGMTFDPYGNLFDADCHSRPIMLLLRGGCYPSFGAPHDGLGFAPDIIFHSHGSTGICGPVYYAAAQFPPEFRDSIYLCNPVTGRIHRDKLVRHGSTPLTDTQPDFVTCDDKWFRPVDLKLGPDGALYVADFYNAVIGHYEAPLDHPRRDRYRGRIWRIVWVGEKGDVTPPPTPETAMGDLTKLPLDALIDKLADANLTVRTLATNWIVDRYAAEADAAAPKLVERLASSDSPAMRAHLLWAIERLAPGGLDDATAAKLAADGDPLVRVHLARAIGERTEWRDADATVIAKLLDDADGYVRRAAAEAMGVHARADQIKPLLAAWAKTPADDTHLVHAIRIALRNHLRDDAIAAAPGRIELTDVQRKRLVEIASVTPTGAAAVLVFRHARSAAGAAIDDATLGRIARNLPPDELDDLIAFARTTRVGNAAGGVSALTAIADAMDDRGVTPAALREWADSLVAALLGGAGDAAGRWSFSAHPDHAGAPAAVWAGNARSCDDGQRDAVLLSSFPRGERQVGVALSPAFDAPAKLTFFVAGHDGFPNQPAKGANLVRLRRLSDGAVVASAPAPRNDVARRVEWVLGADAGQRVRIEIVDGDPADAYAWIAVGRFDLPAMAMSLVVNEPMTDPTLDALRLVARFELAGFADDALRIAADADRPPAARTEAMSAAFAVDRARATPMLIAAVGDASTPPDVRGGAADLLGRLGSPAACEAIVAAMRTSPGPMQQRLAAALAQSTAGAEALLDAVGRGVASARLLRHPPVVDRLRAAKIEGLDARIAQLTASLPPADAELDAKLRRIAAGYAAAPGDATRGRALFAQHCAVCHRIGEQGGRIGPSLDGVGIRGVDRILEDLLDPSRNVDAAFRTTVVTTKGGATIVGLGNRTEGRTLILADATGAEHRVSLDDITTRTESPTSLMPPSLDAALGDAGLRDLLAYLLSEGGTAGGDRE